MIVDFAVARHDRRGGTPARGRVSQISDHFRQRIFRDRRYRGRAEREGPPAAQAVPFGRLFAVGDPALLTSS
jgi:hypothetical protein